MPVIWTIGHSNRAIEHFVDMLTSWGIGRLVDVRLIPKSRFNPQFGLERLRVSLNVAGIQYQHAKDLGGRRVELPDSPNTALASGPFRGYADHMRTPAFRDAQQALFESSARHPTAVMCAEADPGQCHRSLLADSFVLLHELDVRHILSPSEWTPHQLHPDVRLVNGVVSYPAAQKSLFSSSFQA